jgi:integrase
VVTLSGRDIYLGKWSTKASLTEYDRLIGEWLAAGRNLPKPQTDLTVAELAARYWEFAKGYYVKEGRPTGSLAVIRVALRHLRLGYGHTLAKDFGPLALEAVQLKLITAGLSRNTINEQVACIRRAFRWAVAKQLLPPAVLQALEALPGLRKGRSKAKEPEPVRPVAPEVVEATLPHLQPVVRDMVVFERLTGCRPAEVCRLRPCEIDTTNEIWMYRPPAHKCEHHDIARVIAIGPRAQDILRPYLLRDKSVFCFVPAESERKRNAERREARRSPMTPSQAKRQRKRHPMRTAGEHYTTESYRRAIERACDKAFPPPEGLGGEALKLWREEHRWSPNQLRHSCATEVRKHFGLEAAQVTLGHSSADVTQIYAEKNAALAAEVMRKIG